MTSALADFENALAYAHFKLRGGTRNVLLSGGAYLAVLILATGMVYSLTRVNYRREALDALTYGLLGLQFLLVVGYGMFTTGSAVKTDLSSQIIESHRLMPLSSGRAIAGYLVGAPCQAYVLFAANLGVGFAICVLNSAGGTTTRSWLLRNAVLFLFAVFVFALTIFWSFLGRNIGRYVIGLFVLFWMSAGYLFAYIPAFYVVGSPFMDNTIISDKTRISWAHGLGALAQVSLGLLLLTAATRKYRRPHVPAFSTTLGMLLLAAVVGTCGAGIFFWEQIRPFLYEWRDVDPAMQFVSSTGALMWLAMLPVASATKTHVQRRRNRDAGATSAGPKAAHPAVAAAIAAVICLLLLAVSPEWHGDGAIVRTGVVVVTFLLSFSFLLAWAYSITTKPMIVIIVWLILTWGGPLIADSIRYNMMDEPHGPVLGAVSAGSPFGALMSMWSSTRNDTTPGLIFQVGLLALAMVLCYAFSKRPAKKAVPPPLPSVAAA